ncbi:MAG: SNF2 family DNA or RNA helicase [Saprospiraceae bacterium]
MYWLDNIDKYIEHFASPAIQQRGKTLANIGALRSVDYDTQNNKGIAEVSSGEVFTVKINNGVSQDFRNINTECNCDYENGMCKHEVAALHGLKKKFQYNSAAIINIINQTNTIHNSSSELEMDDDILSKYTLEAQYPPRVRETAEMIVKYNTISENILSFDIGEKAYRWEKEKYEYETVNFLMAKDKITTRCTCNKQVMELCNHQMKAVHHIFIELGLPELLKNFPSVDDLKEIAATEYGLSGPEEVDKFFTLTLTNKGPEFMPKDKELVSYSDHLYLVKKLEQINSTTPYNAISETDNYDDNLQGVSIFLDNESDTIPIRLHIISGKSNKKSEKIVSSVTNVDDPSQINPSLRSIFLDYEKIKSLYNNQFPDTVHPKMLNLLTKHKETLLSVPLYYMKEKFSFRRADMRNVEFSETTAKVLIKARSNKAQYVMEGFILFGQEEVPIKSLIGDINSLLLFHNNQFYVIDSLRASRLIQLLIERPILKYSIKSKESFNQQVSQLSHVANLEFSGEDIVIAEKHLEVTEKSIDLSENSESLILQPFIKYEDDKNYRPIIDAEHITDSKEGLVTIKRDKEKEEEFIKSLAEFDTDFEKQAHLGFFYKNLDSVINTPWIFDLYRFCKENEITITGYENLEKINYNPNEAEINISLSSGIDWFEGDIDMTFGGLSVELKSLRDAILNNDTTVKLTDGTQGLLPEEWIERLSAMFRNSDVVDGKLLISKMKFNLIDSLFDEINDEQLKMEIDYRKRLLMDFDNIEEVPLPATVNAELRPYQKTGFYWLKFLDDFGFGGCLADDMGLGKTLQVITFLAYKKSQGAGTNLIVLPKSLLFNWEDEIRKFCPDLTYMIYHGSKRKLELKNFEKYDMILSTYGTVTNDIEDIMVHHFSYCVLDESQAIKNPTSKRYKAMRLVKSDNKIVMTGTPIENQTFDLYAQFNFINPGFFGSANQFKMHFAEPIDMYGNQAVSIELRKLVKPFLLRRTKEQVAKDLPAKTESIIHVEMTAKQRVIYDAFVQRYKDYVSQKISENGIQRSKMFVIEALLKLRQICNSPALLNEDKDYPNESVKIDVIMERLSELVGGHKVLVISQFTSMLSLIREKVEAAQIPYSYLDGSTRNRKAVVDQFNENDDYRVFLLSLKAGGVGLNLASADYVFLVDPWWNPAAESQAIDRAHRIGQKNQVFAYRMICKDSIEEKIQLLQQKKRKMAKDIIQVEESFIKSLTQDDIMALFS